MADKNINLEIKLPKVPDIELIALEGLDKMGRHLGIADDDGSSSLKSISVDLNNDGIFEKLIPNEFLCDSGGCLWLVYSLNLKTAIGEIFSIVLYIDTKQKNGYNVIETYLRNGSGKGTVSFYEYSKGRYNSVNRIDLKGKQIKNTLITISSKKIRDTVGLTRNSPKCLRHPFGNSILCKHNQLKSF